MREQGVEGEYQTQLKKDGFPLVEKDKYKCYYREYFFSPDKKEDLMRTTHTTAHAPQHAHSLVANYSDLCV